MDFIEALEAALEAAETSEQTDDVQALITKYGSANRGPGDDDDSGGGGTGTPPPSPPGG